MRYFFILMFLAFSYSGFSQEHYFVFLKNNPDRDSLPIEQVEELQKDHLANIQRLYKEGVIVAAGPFEKGGGFFIVKETSKKEVQTHLETDPAIAANRFNLEIFPFHMNLEKLCKVDTNAEIVAYHFVRYQRNPETTFTEEEEEEQVQLDHYAYMQHLNEEGFPLLFGFFNVHNEGVLIFASEDEFSAKRATANDPAVKKKYLIPDLKKLWVSKGIFCEE